MKDKVRKYLYEIGEVIELLMAVVVIGAIIVAVMTLICKNALQTKFQEHHRGACIRYFTSYDRKQYNTVRRSAGSDQYLYFISPSEIYGCYQERKRRERRKLRKIIENPLIFSQS